MKKKSLVLLTLIVIFTGGAIIAGYHLLFSVEQNRNNTITVSVSPDKQFGWKFPVTKFPSVGSGSQLAYSSIRDPGGIPQGLPVRLKIPNINVNSAIEDALITPDGRMDVPAGSQNVAWFSLGPHPGKEGSAVIGGHFGTSNGVPWVFYNLDKVKIGDKVYIEDDSGNTLAFQVRMIKSFDRNADATTVFTSSDGVAHLNLITCEGVWNQVNGTYPQRLVVFTNLIPSEGSAPTSSLANYSFTRSLTIGSHGDDVIALQNALEQKGFLSMPSGVSKGLFGALTRAAVAKYQTSVGLQPIGYFGLLTRTKLNLELAKNPVLPNTGKTTVESVVIPNKSLSTSQVIVADLKSVYATPMDGIITALLLLLIIFFGFKIITL